MSAAQKTTLQMMLEARKTGQLAVKKINDNDSLNLKMMTPGQEFIGVYRGPVETGFSKNDGTPQVAYVIENIDDGTETKLRECYQLNKIFVDVAIGELVCIRYKGLAKAGNGKVGVFEAESWGMYDVVANKGPEKSDSDVEQDTLF